MNAPIRSFSRLFLRGLCIVCGLVLLPAAAQDIVATITSASAPGGTAAAPHYVIDSDATNAGAGYTRDSIPASVGVSFSRAGGVTSATAKFRASVELVGSDGLAVVLANANSGTTSIISATQTVSLSAITPTASRTFSFTPRPAVDLGAGKAYTLRYTIQRESTAMIGGNPITLWLTAAGPQNSTAFTTVHFRDSPENSLARRVRAYPTGTPSWTKTHLITTGTLEPAPSFTASVPYFAARYDIGGSNAVISYRLTATVTDDTGAVIPLQNDGQSTGLLSMQPSVATSPITPRAYSGNFTASFRPASQLDSRNRTFRIKVRIEHIESISPNTYLDDGESPQTIALQRLLHFNGNLRFGSLATAFSAISNSPTAGALGTNLVNTTLNVTAGTIPGYPTFTFGNGSALGVQLLSNGDSVVTSGSQPVIVASGIPIIADFGGTRVEYSNNILTASGPQAGATTVFLPQGLSHTPDRSTSAGRYLGQVVIPGSRSLSNQFRHTGNLTLAMPGDAWVFDEARPLLYQVSDFAMAQDGQLHFTAADSEWAHQAAYDQLDAQHTANQHQTATMRRRWSNEGHFRYSEIVPGSLISFGRATDGSARTLEADLSVSPGSFITHFPAASTVTWNTAGTLKIRDGKITGDSVLNDVATMTVAFDGSCPDDDCGPPPGSATDSVTLFPNDKQLTFTPDGGLCGGAGISPKTLQWGIRGDGNFTHRSDEFRNAAFHAPGQQLYAADNPLALSGPFQSSADTLTPGVLSLAGYDPADHLNPVYPETTRYLDGVGIYPGATFVTTGSGNIGASRIADLIGEYPYELLENVTKYYVRRSGVSGRHVAVDGTYAPNLSLYDYNFELTRYQLTFLSNTNEDSWINGSVSVPAPSNFTQKFLDLKLSCTGALEEPVIDPDDSGPKPLAYWNGSFTPLAMTFAPRVGADCDDNRLLTIGLTSGAANLSTPLSGTLAFMPNGNIGTLEDKIVGVDGRLGLPSLVRLDGPGSEKYPLVPVSKLYFSNPASPGAPTSPDKGYVNFAATCNVPFFEDLKVHVMTSAQTGVPAPLYMAGGWTEGGETFFSNKNFDITHRGFPLGAPFGTYQNPQTVTPYVVRATQSLFGLVPLDYPLKWNSTARYFQSWPSAPTDLLVLTVEHQVDYLSAENAEITFGAQYDGLPKINLVSAAAEIAEGELGAARALTNAAQAAVTKTLTQGVDEIGNLVDDTMEKVLDRALDSIESDVITPLYTELRNSYNAAAAANSTYQDWVDDGSDGLKSVFDERLGTPVSAGADSVIGRLNQLSAATDQASSLIQRVSDAVDEGILAIDSVAGEIQTYRNAAGDIVAGFEAPPGYLPDDLLSGILTKVSTDGGPAERVIVQRLVASLIAELAPPDLAAILDTLLDDASSEINGELNALLVEFDPTLERVTEVLMQARAYLVDVKTKLAANGDLLESFQEIITNAETEIETLVAEIHSAAYAYIERVSTAATYGPSAVLGSAGNLFDEFSQEEFTAFIRAELRNRLLASAFIGQIQYSLRQTISEFDIALRSAIDSAFGEVNRMCKELIKESLGPIDDTINGLTGDINSYVGAGSVDGYAHIQGDTLRRLRLDAKVQLKVPDEMKLQAYFEMLCYDSETTTGAVGCLEAGKQMVEVKIGALDVPLDWVSPDLSANLDVWFSMQKQPVKPLGIGGALVMTGGELDFQSLKVTGFGASVAVGSQEAYLAATARVVVSSYEASGGIFFGRTCSLDPLLLVDPDAASLLGNPPFTGAYVYGEVWIPISEVILGIPASCLFRISAGVGAGAFYFAEGPTYGGRMLLGVSGEALCVVSIRGDVSMTGVMSGGSLRFAGRGNLTGKAGYCPFCVKFRESARITYQDGSWDVDF